MDDLFSTADILWVSCSAIVAVAVTTRLLSRNAHSRIGRIGRKHSGTPPAEVIDNGDDLERILNTSAQPGPERRRTELLR